jgi:DNA repair protein RadA/Sms
MAKDITYYICNKCGHEEPRWLGRCPECGSWNSFREMKVSGNSSGTGGGRKGGAARAGGVGGAVRLEDVGYSEDIRLDAGIGELNRVLGGGIMPGAAALIGGEPGIGKSTLMLQLAASVRVEGPVLYVSGEESSSQIRVRAERLGVFGGIKKPGAENLGAVDRETGAEGRKADLHLACESDLERIMAVLRELKPKVVVIDSVQTLMSPEAGNVPGTVNQLKYGCYELIEWAREEEASIFLVAHVTKEGAIAGPKVIEHMVDTVLYFEQAGAGLRIVRAVKNRHGSVDEIGLFTMEGNGLVQVGNPASFFLQERETELPAGITAAPVYEGSRVLMVEIQALVVPAKGGFSRIYSDRIEGNRVSRIAAVLEKQLSVKFSDQDIYVNVAGGIRLNEVGIELPLATALYSARTGIPVPREVALAGEISLAGEIRPTPHMQRRVRTAGEMGFSRFLGPRDVHAGKRGREAAYEVVGTIAESIGRVFGKGKKVV